MTGTGGAISIKVTSYFFLKIHNHTQYVDKYTCCQDKNIDDIDIEVHGP
jgi:hypothetical protein